ncbi:phosphatase PAP2 family protein [Bifidobacterium cuniculi]|uniref:Type II phosphatidic acid phosphatase protein n=1 Tax=Bifidobacterium cuniculi TaxID=1688 RepID=A0A087B2L5_9BIFI|nr:phosphatase PAP2 family protein [Bifidobacterium cuniculi]KFI65265.1 type II phosphatidic acid phosphatase protein [Bifidobacterium cuniculi]
MVVKRYLQPILGVLCLAGALTFTALITRYGVLPMDTAVYGWIAAHLISPGLTPVIQVVTQLASAVVLIVLTIIILVFVRNRRIGVAVALNLALAALLNQVIKRCIQRPRPYVTHLVVEHGFSFPSGHSMAATAFYGFLVFLVWHYVGNRAARTALIVPCAAIIPVILFTRVYLGVHWASDVLAGCLFSLAWLLLVAVPAAREFLLEPGPRPQHARR